MEKRKSGTETRVRITSKIGILLNQILQNINQAINESTPTPHLKLIMYSAHDITIVSLQRAMNVYGSIIPPYASCHIFEVYQEDDESFTLDMYFRNRSDSEAYLLTLPSCTKHCPLQDFIRITRDLISDNRDEECKLSSGSVRKEVILGVALSVGIVLFLLLIFLCCWWNHKTHHHRVPSSSDEMP
uniref:lysosomal acid phosphatase-like n=1 Tax=Pristiophorus japonicus TaxID=55135 RepID=UPI00398EF048